jgi:UDP-glucose 4-epimerase
MKILVTGGAGFIGSNVVDSYIEAGHEVVVVDDLSTGRKENINLKAKFYEMDIRSPEIKNVFRSERPDILNHHAAQMSVPASVEDPIFDADVNVEGFLNVMESARKSGVKKVIFISSGGAVYGEAEEYPTSEQYYPAPLSPYAITKYAAEKYLAFYSHQYGLDYTVLRYANVYGPRQTPHGEAGVVAIFIERLSAGKRCTVYHFPGEPEGMLRDYCYVGDIARANLMALSAGNGEILNIGTGTPTATRPLFHTISDAIQSAGIALSGELREPGSGSARGGDLRRSCLNVEKARRIFGWNAEVSLTDGIKNTLSWWMKEKR